LDEDGFLKITDRKKELFKTSGGKYIAPSPIEQMIKGSRFVSQVVLVGNDRKFPAALIVPVKKIALLEQELTVEGGELTPTLKVKRRVVDEKYRHVIDEIYAE
jgi:long-chain acyl-CoA synthetase